MKTIALILILATAAPAVAQPPTDRAAAIAQAKAALALLEAIPEPLPATPAPMLGAEMAAVNAQLASLRAQLETLAADVAAGRIENRTFFDAVKSEWKGILGKIAVYGLPLVGAVIAGYKAK